MKKELIIITCNWNNMSIYMHIITCDYILKTLYVHFTTWMLFFFQNKHIVP